MHYIAYHCSASPPHGTRTNSAQTWNDTLTSIGARWLETLVSCGANLQRYAHAEKSTLKYPETIIWRDRRGRSHCWRLTFLLCGPRVADWRVFVVPDVYVYRRRWRPGVTRTVCEGHQEYEMAGEFWEGVEKPVAKEDKEKEKEEELCRAIPGGFDHRGGGEENEEEMRAKLTVGRPVMIKGPIF